MKTLVESAERYLGEDVISREDAITFNNSEVDTCIELIRKLEIKIIALQQFNKNNGFMIYNNRDILDLIWKLEQLIKKVAVK